MTSSTSIECRDLGKAYRIGAAEERSDTLFGAVTKSLSVPLRNLRRLRGLDISDGRDERSIVWALKDISFEVRPGEVVGFVGRNGAGKSTLLKVLSRITPPTTGSARIVGRVSSLLEVGTGFHPELSGRENIFMNGTILGMSRAEIRSKFDEIVDFSGVEKFLDTPVKRYSSGMKVRLGFAVAAHLEPEVLIIDEVLAVGDAEFQKKSLGKMENVASSGRTVLFVSHNMGAVQNLCTRAIALHNGRMVEDGEPAEVIQNYLARLVPPSGEGISSGNPDRRTTGPLHITSGYLVDGAGQRTEHVNAGDQVSFVFEYDNPAEHERLNFVVEIMNGSGIVVHYLNAQQFGIVLPGRRRGSIVCKIPRLALPIGEYVVRTVLSDRSEAKDLIPVALSFNVIGSTFYRGAPGPNARMCTTLTDCQWDSLAAGDEEQPAGQVAASN